MSYDARSEEWAGPGMRRELSWKVPEAIEMTLSFVSYLVTLFCPAEKYITGIAFTLPRIQFRGTLKDPSSQTRSPH